MGKNEKESMNLVIKEDLIDSCSLFPGFSRKYNEKNVSFLLK